MNLRWPCLVGALLWVSVAAAEAPPLLPIQGYLTDADGVPVDGPHRLTFSIYDAMGAGNNVFTDDYTSLDIDAGYFTAYLGAQAGNALDLSLLDGLSEAWLEIVIDGVDVISPRTRIGSVAYAGFAHSCGDALNLGGVAAEAHVHGPQNCEAGEVMTGVAADGTIVCSKGPLLRTFRNQVGTGTLTNGVDVPGAITFEATAGETATLSISVSGRPNADGHVYIGLYLDDELKAYTSEYSAGGTWIRTADGTIHVPIATTGSHTFSAKANIGSGTTSFADNAGEFPLGGVSWMVQVGP